MKKLVTVTNDDIITNLRGKDDYTLIYPLKFFCIGYDNYYDIDQIDDFVLVNRLLEENELEDLASILRKSSIKGIIFDDLGILEIIKDLKITKILLLDHLATNVRSINYYLEYVDSVVVSSDLEKSEIEYILENAKKSLVITVFGSKKLMYSRRTLLTNYATFHNLPLKKNIEAQIEDKTFQIRESREGTSFLAGTFYNGLELLGSKNVLYFWYDFSGLDSKNMFDIIIKNEVNVSSDPIFLDKKMTFKVKETEK